MAAQRKSHGHQRGHGGAKSLAQAERAENLFLHQQATIWSHPSFFTVATAATVAYPSNRQQSCWCIAFLSLWLSVWSLAVAELLSASFSAWKEVLASRASSGPAIGKALLFSFFTLPFLGAECFAIFAFTKFGSLPLAVFSFRASRCTFSSFY